MPDIRCDNQHRLKVPDRFSGKTIRCPVCKSPVRVPEFAPLVTLPAPQNLTSLRSKMHLRTDSLMMELTIVAVFILAGWALAALIGYTLTPRVSDAALDQ